MMSKLLWLGCVTVIFHALLTHDGDKEYVVSSDVTSLFQDKLMVKQRDGSLSSRGAGGVTVSAEASTGDLQSSSGWRRLEAHLLQMFTTNPELATAPKMTRHPFPSLDWSDVKWPSSIICGVALFLAGVLCSAGGIGGGGVYVTVLMVAGQLSPHDAVPLSKAVVFCGSLSSLVLNLRKSLLKPADGGQAKTLIDYNICRLVVPSALFGTLLGVLLNSQIAPWVIVAMLVGILVVMTLMSSKEFYKHYTEEGAVSTDSSGDSPPTEARDVYSKYLPQRQTSELDPLMKKMQYASIRGTLCKGEGIGAFALLILVICCGALRAHAFACQTVLVSDAAGMLGRDECQRPIIKTVLGSSLLKWMATGSLSGDLLLSGTVVLPMLLCLTIIVGYSTTLVRREQWQLWQVILYCVMAVSTGCFAGLVGIGGGLVFSPFILWMTGDPAVAVATSSTCVIFTSSSTTFQYLFTDRITMALTLIYGVVNLFASYVGTTIVHKLDTLPNRKTLISGIVCLGVIASVVLSVYKLVSMGVAH